MGFSKPRLEGRAFEHGLGRDSGFNIRMKDASGGFVDVVGPHAKHIREEMRSRADSVVEDMASQGLFRKGADCHVQIGAGCGWVDKSVDLRVSVAAKKAEAILEVKWSRQSLGKSAVEAAKSLPWLRDASARGRWASSRRPVQATAVGTLVVGPRDWHCSIEATDGSWSLTFPDAANHHQPKRSGSGGRSGCQKRKGAMHKEAAEAKWRTTTKGKTLALSLQKTYRSTRKIAAMKVERAGRKRAAAK